VWADHSGSTVYGVVCLRRLIGSNLTRSVGICLRFFRIVLSYVCWDLVIGWAPSESVLSNIWKVLSFGSCFWTRDILNACEEEGRRSYVNLAFAWKDLNEWKHQNSVKEFPTVFIKLNIGQRFDEEKWVQFVASGLSSEWILSQFSYWRQGTFIFLSTEQQPLGNESVNNVCRW
jgi:hypothetical protein